MGERTAPDQSDPIEGCSSGSTDALSKPSTSAALPPGQLEAAYALIFERASLLMSGVGRVRQELIGLAFEGETPLTTQFEHIDRSNNLSRLMSQMLSAWPIVAHTFQGWSIPDSSSLGGMHGRREVVVIALHTPAEMWMAACRVERPGLSNDVDRSEAAGRSVHLVRGPLRHMAAT